MVKYFAPIRRVRILPFPLPLRALRQKLWARVIAVKRGEEQFPCDFMFQLSAEEVSALRSQIATSKPRRGGRRYAPYAFSEHGAIMLANVLNSGRAIEVSVYVVRAFVRLREMMVANKEMAARLGELERKVASHDEAIGSLVSAIQGLMEPQPPLPRKRIGFRVEEGRPSYGRHRRTKRAR